LEGKPEKKKRKAQRKKATAPCSTAGEAIEKMLKEKKLSQKINYDVLKALREGASSTSSPAPASQKQEALSSGTLMPPPTSRGYWQISSINKKHFNICFSESSRGEFSQRWSLKLSRNSRPKPNQSKKNNHRHSLRALV
jgi:hypothetical protein